MEEDAALLVGGDASCCESVGSMDVYVRATMAIAAVVKVVVIAATSVVAIFVVAVSVKAAVAKLVVVAHPVRRWRQ